MGLKMRTGGGGKGVISTSRLEREREIVRCTLTSTPPPVEMKFPLLTTAVLLSKSVLVEGCTTTNSVNTNCETLTNTNFQTAVDLWVSNPTSAEDTYGHIKDWNVKGVTNMKKGFQNKNTFNEDISGWDVSSVTNMWALFK
ncbi:hypothetical protein TrCOL_g2790 [Triparma columacea]|uniref:BspA family leucine-rich repeat surface protein n=1 Tax=Triparma columacea TaxID=722753 RepID=A0A9W7L1L0_9STRA|nr:hypothetical protein TrCOL_g2790 [Triparma columacea]